MFLACVFLLLIHSTTSIFKVRFRSLGIPEDMKNATAHALSLIDQWIDIRCTIYVDLFLEDFQHTNAVATGGFPNHCEHPANSYILIPSALYTHLSNCSNCVSDTEAAHIEIRINSNERIIPFYFGDAQNVPPTHIDFITLIMHEMMHGLGFVNGFLSADGIYIFAPSVYLYDIFIFGKDITPPLPPSYTLADAGVLNGGPLFFHYDNESFQLYAPPTFIPGTTAAHIFNPKTIVSYKLDKGTAGAVRCLSNEIRLFFRAMGYPLKNVSMPCEVSSSDETKWFIHTIVQYFIK